MKETYEKIYIKSESDLPKEISNHIKLFIEWNMGYAGVELVEADYLWWLANKT